MFKSAAIGISILALLIQLSETKVELQENGYSGLLIAINPSVDEDPAIIESLKAAWTEASEVLYRATKNRAYFKSITILVPQSWNEREYNYTNGESYKYADVVVADQNPLYGDNPYTLQYGTCGQPGSYIHLTPGYLTEDSAEENYGPRGKVITHEWAHYRWGVFDELVTEGYDSFYLSQAGKIEANRCPLTIQGDNYYVDWSTGSYRTCNIDPKTMLPEDGCTYFPNERKSSKAYASMMSYQYLDSVYAFCEDDTSDSSYLHNRAAPNEQNRLCNLRSTWSVILDSPDFAQDQNLPNITITDTTPNFRVVQPLSYQRYVLVLDTSGSMSGTRLDMMRQAASTFILQAAPTGSEIGIVQFSNTAYILSDLVEIETYQDRLDLANKLPDVATGGTSIGSGIHEGITVLERSCTNVQGVSCTRGGILIVISDGEENASPTLADVYQEIIYSEIIVDSIVFTTAADPMLQVIADDTGGTWYFADENVNNATAALTDAFVTSAQTDDGDNYREIFQIHSSSFQIGPYATHTDYVTIDSTIGNNTIFTFAWSQTQYEAIGVVLKAPSGCTYSTNVSPGVACQPAITPSVDIDFKTIAFQIPGTAQVGEWIYDVSAVYAYSQDVVVTVTSMASDRNVQPILVESGMGNVTTSDGEAVVVYAQVSMGFAPVLDAEVIATIDRPYGGPVSLELRDKGADPDVRKNDGVYSRYFTQYNGQGRYSVQVTITGIDGQTKSTYDQTGSKAAVKAGSYDSKGNFKLNMGGAVVTTTGSDTGNFSRYTAAGGFSYSGTSSADTFPPSKVLDLTARQQDVTLASSGIQIQFTAPGDDYDRGTASYYDIHYSFNDPSSLTIDFDNCFSISQSEVISGCLRSPQEAGNVESLVILPSNLPSSQADQVVSVAVRAVDAAGNRGEVSNVATLTYFIEPLVYEPPTDDCDSYCIAMIIFICTTVCLLAVVLVLLRTLQREKETKSKASSYENRAGRPGEDPVYANVYANSRY